MSKLVDFYFDVGSPTAYLAFTQLPKICADAGAELVLHPMLLGGVFQATGNKSPAFLPAKGAWMFQDLPRFAKRYGVTYERNPFFPVNTLPLMRGAIGLQMTQDERFMPYLNTVYRAMWVEQANLNEPAVIAQTVAKAGVSADEFMQLIGRQDVKDRLKQATEAAVARGVFGAPTMFVAGEMHFGQDRLDFVAEALRRVS